MDNRDSDFILDLRFFNSLLGVPCACLVPTLPDPFLLFAARRNRFPEVSHLTASSGGSAIICHNTNKRMRILREGHVIEEMDSRPSSDV